MNKTRKKKIVLIVNDLVKLLDYEKIDFIKDEIEDALWEEEDTYNNLSNNFRYSTKGIESKEAINSLQEAINILEKSIDIYNETNNINETDEENEMNYLFKVCDINSYIYQAVIILELII